METGAKLSKNWGFLLTNFYRMKKNSDICTAKREYDSKASVLKRLP